MRSATRKRKERVFKTKGGGLGKESAFVDAWLRVVSPRPPPPPLFVREICCKRREGPTFFPDEYCSISNEEVPRGRGKKTSARTKDRSELGLSFPRSFEDRKGKKRGRKSPSSFSHLSFLVSRLVVRGMRPSRTASRRTKLGGRTQRSAFSRRCRDGGRDLGKRAKERRERGRGGGKSGFCTHESSGLMRMTFSADGS